MTEKNPATNTATNSFSAGFTLGLIAGAIGVFLLDTEQGSVIREKMSQEWEKAQDYLEEEGLLNKQQEKTITELLQTVKTAIIDRVGLIAEPKKPVKKRVYTKKSEQTQFKGV